MDYNENAPFLQTKKCKKTRTRSQEYRRPWEIGPREREHILQLYSHYALDENKKRVRIIYQPYVSEPIVFKGYRFIITERPTLGNLSEFIDELLNKRVNYVVRCSAPSFNPKILDQLGIKTIEIYFPDGTFPDKGLINKWLETVSNIFTTCPDSTIALYCISGLERAPVLVAIALMEAGMPFEDAIMNIRKVRNGALNCRQLEELEKYVPSYYLWKGHYRRRCSIL